jgi:hypothetical protein
MTVLVTAASKRGSTLEIAAAIADPSALLNSQHTELKEER